MLCQKSRIARALHKDKLKYTRNLYTYIYLDMLHWHGLQHSTNLRVYGFNEKSTPHNDYIKFVDIE